MPLSDHPVGPVIPVSDVDAALAFYAGALGLAAERTPGGHTLHAGHGTAIHLLELPGDAGRADWPLASFRVDDLAATVAELRARGVGFLGPESGLPFALDEQGIAEQEGLSVAWMLDPDGHVLTVFALR